MKINNVTKDWKISFKIEELSLKHVLLEIKSGEKYILSAYLHGNGVMEVVARFNKNERPLVLYSRYDVNIENIVDISFTGNKIELYVNNVLQDEEWPLGEMELENSLCVVEPMNFSISSVSKKPTVSKESCTPKKVEIKAFRPEGHNVYAGDCMPFEHEGTYHLFYLYDRRRHNSKYGLGAHQWAHLATDDLTNWYEYPMAISIDAQYEGSICTGSFLHNAGQFYAFYAVRMSDGSPAQITWSVSDDCIHFEKTNKTLTLSERYDQGSARDPKVFHGEDGQFHMLVTTSLNDETRKGALAHLVSSDLENWIEQEAAFVVVNDHAQPECPDYFKFGDWYYLIYSLNGQARYVISKKPFTDWIELDNNTIGTVSLRVPKIAPFNKADEKRLIAAGFIPVMSDGYGGEISCLEVFQNADGSLAFGLVKEILK